MRHRGRFTIQDLIRGGISEQYASYTSFSKHMDISLVYLREGGSLALVEHNSRIAITLKTCPHGYDLSGLFTVLQIFFGITI